MMPRFHLNMNECGDVTVDQEGQELANLEAARSLAIERARSIMAAEVGRGRLCLSCSIRIQDGGGTLLLTVQFREALTFFTGSDIF